MIRPLFWGNAVLLDLHLRQSLVVALILLCTPGFYVPDIGGLPLVGCGVVVHAISWLLLLSAALPMAGAQSAVNIPG
jgi:hypothetical protein